MLLIYIKVIAFLLHSGITLFFAICLWGIIIQKRTGTEDENWLKQTIFILVILGFFVCAWVDYWPPVFTEIIIEYR